jgi:hypothetical protein
MKNFYYEKFFMCLTPSRWVLAVLSVASDARAELRQL